jgi:hypothetical protein
MDAKLLAIVPLIFLGAAAAPPGDCGFVPHGATVLPPQQDLAGRLAMQPGLSGQVFAALPTPNAMPGCRSPLPSAAQPGTLRSDNDDILHGLPAPELTRPLHEPRQVPFIR